jgi:hypothetical protein
MHATLEVEPEVDAFIRPPSGSERRDHVNDGNQNNRENEYRFPGEFLQLSVPFLDLEDRGHLPLPALKSLRIRPTTAVYDPAGTFGMNTVLSVGSKYAVYDAGRPAIGKPHGTG